MINTTRKYVKMNWEEIDEKIREEEIIEKRMMNIIKDHEAITINELSTIMNMDAEKVKKFIRDMFERGMIYEPQYGIYKVL